MKGRPAGQKPAKHWIKMDKQMDKQMGNRSSQLAMIGGMLLFAASTAGQATMIESDPNLNFGLADDFYVGSVVDGVPSSPADETSYINNLTTLTAGTGPDATFGDDQSYDRTDSNLVATFATASPPVVKDEDPAGGTSTTLDGVFQYILGKYGGGSLVWYHQEGFTGTITLQSTFAFDNTGLSHISAFNQVGDTSVPAPATLLLLGFGLVGLGFGLRRRSQRACSQQ